MLAIVLATERNSGVDTGSGSPGFLLPLGDRPFLQHLVESLALLGATQIEFVFSDYSEPAAHLLGDGSRWGCIFHFRCLSKAGVGSLLRELSSNANGNIILARADRILALASDFSSSVQRSQTVFFHTADQTRKEQSWNGWALFADRSSLDIHLALNPAEVFLSGCGCLQLADDATWMPVEHELSIVNGAALLASQRDLLTGALEGFHVGGRQPTQGIFVSRSVYIHPTATLVPPVYLGPNSHISRHATIGPFAVLSEDCIVGMESNVSNSVVGPGTYVGESLDIQSAIVDKEYVLDVRLGASYRMVDNFLIGSLKDAKSSGLVRNWTDRVMALLLLILLSPLAGMLKVLRAHPAQERPTFFNKRPRLIHFACVFVPGLWAVVKGDLSLVGLQPRSPSELLDLAADWRLLHARTKTGLVTDAIVNLPLEPTEEEVYASECYYAAVDSFSNDLKILSRYLLSLSKDGSDSLISVKQTDRAQ
jgi:NDP-sugar pyrophosphorylase family protein